MEKYLKINWSIRCMVGFLLIILIFLILSNIFGLLFFYSLKESILLLESPTAEKITIPVLLGSLIFQFGILYTLAKIIDYKRWAVIAIGVCIGIPGSIISFGYIGYVTYFLITGGIGYEEYTSIYFPIIFGIFLCIAGFFIKYNREMMRLYKNIKNFDTVERKELQDTKPNFIYFLCLAIIPLSLGGMLMVFFYNPVIPLDIPEGYFEIEGFDLNNPIYTDEKICKDFEDEIQKMKDLEIEKIRTVNKDDTDVAVILAKKSLFSKTDIQRKIESINGNNQALSIDDYLASIQESYPDGYDRIIKEIKIEQEKRAKYKAYIQNYPDQGKESLKILRSQLPVETVKKLQELTRSMPENINCNIRNDQKLEKEFISPLTHNLAINRIYDAAIKLALAENQRSNAIELLRSLHDFNRKFFNTNISITKGMIGIILLKIEFGSVESILENGTNLEKAIIREIYNAPYDIKKNQLDAWKGEYFLLEHFLVGRGKSIKKISMPYIFNGEDMINRAIILLYAGKIAEIQNDYDFLEKIEKNKLKNNENFLSETERSYLKEGRSTWRSNEAFFAKLYNPIGKFLIEVLLPPRSSYDIRYQTIGLYQDYIRYDLLGAERKK